MIAGSTYSFSPAGGSRPDHRYREEHDDDACTPRDDIGEPRVSIFAHEFFAINEKEHEDQQEWKKHTICHLREKDNPQERQVRDQHDAGSPYYEEGVKPIEDWSLREPLIDTRLSPQSFTDVVGGCQGKNRSGQDRGVHQTHGKQDVSEVSSERPQSGSRISRIGDVPVSRDVE